VKIIVECDGGFQDTSSFLDRCELGIKKLIGAKEIKALEAISERGVQALSQATPVDTGKTAASWSYEMVQEDDSLTIYFRNSNTVSTKYGTLTIAILLQYGHGTRNGGYVVGRDYINPALRTVFDELAETAWKEVIGD
jgi:hypothetical protein